MKRFTKIPFCSLILFILFGIASTIFVACNNSPFPLQIGFIGTLSGKYSDIGTDVLTGVQLAINESNESGGVHGKPITLVVKDDGGKPEQAIEAAKALKEMGINTIIGPNLSSVAIKLVPWCDNNDVLLVSATVSTAQLAGLDDSLIRTIAHNGYHRAMEMANFLKEQLRVQRGIILYDEENEAYSRDIVNHTEKAMEELGIEVSSFPFRSGREFNYGKMIKKTVPSDTDFIYLVASALDTAMFSWQIKKQNIRATLFIRAWALTDELFRVGNEAVEGAILLSSNMGHIKNKNVETFRQKLSGLTIRKAEKFMVYGYEAADTLIQGLEKDIHNPKKAILEIASFKGIQETFHIDQFGDVQRPMASLIIKNGKTILFTPEQTGNIQE